MTEYETEFFKAITLGSKKSAETVVPLVIDLLHPSSVIDIGCGTGAWLSVFQKHGVDILGVDGDYVDSSVIEIPRETFIPADVSSPLDIGRTFDLVVSLEVAEHLSPKFADQFIDNLTKHGSIILFSAAIPLQGGTHHVNEQWPDYWSDKFSSRGYVCVDYMRRLIWSRPDIDWWYAQNMLLFVQLEQLDRPDLVTLKPWVTDKPMSLVHPHPYLERSRVEHLNGKQLLRLAYHRFLKKIRTASR